MTNKNWTPGPWVSVAPRRRHVYQGTDITHFYVATEKTRGDYKEEGFSHYKDDPDNVDNIELCNTFLRDMTLEEGAANASLIAAAPELYDALELLYDHARLYMDVSDNVVREAELTMAKARGELSSDD